MIKDGWLPMHVYSSSSLSLQLEVVGACTQYTLIMCGYYASTVKEEAACNHGGAC
jgi:hypothetical protein